MDLWRSDKVCKPCDALCATWFNGAIRIEHAVTDDLPDGTPVLPGFVNDRIFWALVERLPDWPISERRTLEEKWLGEYGAFLRLSAAEQLVVIPWHVWARFLGEVRR